MNKTFNAVFIGMLFCIYAASPTFGQTTAQATSAPIQMTDEVMLKIKDKLQGKVPNFEDLTRNISNAQARLQRIEVLKEDFNRFDPKSKIRTPLLQAVFVSDALKKTFEADVVAKSMSMNDVRIPLQSYGGVQFQNADAFTLFNYSQLDLKNKVFADLSQNSKMIPGFIVLEFENTHYPDKEVILPTVANGFTAQPDTSKQLVAFVSKVEFLDKNRKKFFEKTFTPPAVAPTAENTIENIPDKLAKTGTAKDFDIML